MKILKMREIDLDIEDRSARRSLVQLALSEFEVDATYVASFNFPRDWKPVAVLLMRRDNWQTIVSILYSTLLRKHPLNGSLSDAMYEEGAIERWDLAENLLPLARFISGGVQELERLRREAQDNRPKEVYRVLKLDDLPLETALSRS